MKVLVATRSTQGTHSGDYAHTVDGELVTPLSVTCSSPATCGCGRGFPGLGSSRATTTAMVVDRPLLTRSDLAQAVEDALERGGWLHDLDDEAIDELVEAHVTSIELVCACYPVGTVVSRWGGRVYDRPSATAA